MKNQTPDEFTLFAEVLFHDKFNFVECLDKRALKILAREHAFNSLL